MSDDEMVVWAVVCGNYEPIEVDSLWATEDLAHKREEKIDAADPGNMWRVIRWGVGTVPE